MTNELRADISLIIVTIFWGTSFPVTSLALRDMSPYAFLTYRYILSAVIMLILTHKKLKNLNKATFKAALYIGGTLFFGTIIQTVGLLYTTPSKSGFISGLSVVLVPLLIGIVSRKLPDNKTILGVIFSVAGLFLISINKASPINFGDILTLSCAFLFATQILVVDSFAKDKDIMLLTAMQIVIVACLGIILSLLLGKLSIKFTLLSIAAIIYTSLFCTVAAYIVQNKMQPYLKPTHAAIIFLLEPVAGAASSVFIGDKLSGRAYFGAALILFGMLITSIKIRKND